MVFFSGGPVPLDWSVFVLLHIVFVSLTVPPWSKCPSLYCWQVILSSLLGLLILVSATAFRSGTSVRPSPISSHLPTLKLFGLTETHIQVNDTPSFLNDLTPHGYALFHRPHHGNTGGYMGFLVKYFFAGDCA